MVHKRSEKKLQERKDKAFSKRKKVSGHPNRLEWLFGPPVVFQIFLDRHFLYFSFFYIYIFFIFYFFGGFFYKGHVISAVNYLLYSVVYLVSNQKIGLGR
jgi:hypothetical protein